MIPFLTWLLNPFSVSLALVLLIAIRVRRDKEDVPERRSHRRALSWFTLGWLLVWSQPLLVNVIGLWLESPYPFVSADSQPACGAIVLLGGGMGAPKQQGGVPEMFGSADRVWHAARLWRAGKANYIIASGLAESASSVVLLRDLGVPSRAILVEGRAGNTVENGIFVRRMLDEHRLSHRVLLVTSAWHMRRSSMIFAAAGLEPVSAAVDHEATYGGWRHIGKEGLRLGHVLPSAQTFAVGCLYVKECQGLIGDWCRVRLAVKGGGLEK